MRDTEYDAIVFDNDGVLTELTETDRLREAVERSFAHFDVTPEERLVTRAVEEDALPFEAVAEVHGLDPEEWWARREGAAGAIQREDIPSGRKALYVGDSEKDVVAARRASIDSAFLRREHRAGLVLDADPTYEFADLRSLVDAVQCDPADR